MKTVKVLIKCPLLIDCQREVGVETISCPHYKNCFVKYQISSWEKRKTILFLRKLSSILLIFFARVVGCQFMLAISRIAELSLWQTLTLRMVVAVILCWAIWMLLKQIVWLILE